MDEAIDGLGTLLLSVMKERKISRSCTGNYNSLEKWHVTISSLSGQMSCEQSTKSSREMQVDCVSRNQRMELSREWSMTLTQLPLTL